MMGVILINPPAERQQLMIAAFQQAYVEIKYVQCCNRNNRILDTTPDVANGIRLPLGNTANNLVHKALPLVFLSYLMAIHLSHWGIFFP